MPGSEPDEEPSKLVKVRVDRGPKQQIITISLEAAEGWMDTGLDPVQLATRPVLLGFDVRMLWAIDGETTEPPVPHLAFRHVAEETSSDPPPFRYAASPTDPPVPESEEIQPLGPRNRLRFPCSPGRIEVKFIHFDSAFPVRGFQGYLRIMAMMQRAGPRDVPHKRPVDNIRVAPWEPGFDIPERLPDPSEAAAVTISEEL